MSKSVKYLTHGALLAALYVALTHLQNLLIPNSASMAIQFRASEALCVLAFFTPAAIPGLTLGCLLFNISFAGALPLDWLVGTAASGLSTAAMWLKNQITDLIPEHFDHILAWLEEQRPQIKSEIPDETARGALFAALFSACLERGRPLTRDELEELL